MSAARSYFETVACRMLARRASSAWLHPFLRRACRMRSASGLMVAQHRHLYALAQRYASAYNAYVTDRELVTLTAALLAARRQRWSPERAVAEALRLWYFVGGKVGPPVRVATETAADHLRNALQVLTVTAGRPLDAAELAAVRQRLELALAAVEGGGP